MLLPVRVSGIAKPGGGELGIGFGRGFGFSDAIDSPV
jgi:hypothetical protein